jgi:hypothetical protein
LLDEINNKLHYSEDGYDNVFEKFNSDVHGDINIFLSLRHTRKFASGSVISFNNNKYFAFDYQTKKIMNFMPYTPTLILLTYDNKILLNIRNKFYYAVKYDKYDMTKSTKHVTFPPKASHPWYQLNDFLIFKKQYRVTPNEIYEKSCNF